ncbi:MAG: hypothetical protein SOX56_06870 [[Pasteurella] mairii]|uniref:Uncharacterized protein n=1 Tax=[Pasteurella] mairii TaxID=757 RepID=A0A379B6B3_9PAST|nr:hypothetical protein [[Pasteurella] mairii]SUB34163.1 Uncharacterised protein [[Pasteurella] mairii]
MEIIIGIIGILAILYFMGRKSQNAIERDLNILVKGAIADPHGFVNNFFPPLIFSLEQLREHDRMSACCLIRNVLFEALVLRGHLRDNLIKDIVATNLLDRAAIEIYRKIC